MGSGYLPNKKVSESASKEVQFIINKYNILSNGYISHSKLTSIIATEIERFLYPQHTNDAVIESFYKTVSNNIEYMGVVISTEVLDIQTYIGCRRSLLNESYDSLFYAVLTKQIPEIKYASSEEEIKNISKYFADKVKNTDKFLHLLITYFHR